MTATTRIRLITGFKIPAMAAAGIVMLVLSCGDGAVEPPPPPAPVATAVTVNPGSVALSALGETARFTAQVRDQNGQAMAGAAIAWASSAASVATVDASGVVTAAANGSATITATAGSVSGTAAVTVAQVVTAVAVSPAADTLVAFGDTVRLVAEATDANGHAVAAVTEFSWSSSDTLVARVNDSGLVTGVDEGTATITAMAGDYSGAAEITTVENPDRTALVALYEATDGPNWVDNTNWLSDAPLREWYGVEADASGRVVALRLSGQWSNEAQRSESHGLTGRIPPELGNLANLKWLKLENNDLSGPVPPQLGDLANLIDLDLGSNDLSGSIPQQLGNLASLERLFLSDNNLHGPIPPTLGDLASLVRVRLRDNNLYGPIPPELSDLSDLVSLDLSGNSLNGPIPLELGSLTSLDWLDLGDNNLTGPIPPELGNLVNLHYLDFAFNQLSGPIPAELGNLRQLHSLWVHWNLLTGPVPHAVLDLPSLTNFSWNCGPLALCVPGTSEFVEWADGLGGTGPFCNASDEATLRNLFELTAGDEWAQSDGWAGSPALEEWHGVRTDSLGRVTALHLSDNGLSGALSADIADLSQLTELRIDGNAIEGRLPLSLIQLDLREFHYDGTRLCEPADQGFQAWLSGIESHSGTGSRCAPLTDRDGLVALYNAAGGASWVDDRNWLSDAPLRDWHGVDTDDQGRVVSLELTRNNLIGVIPPELSRLAELRVLDLAGNDLSGKIPPELDDLGNLEELILGWNSLSGPIPPELGNLANLRRLNLHDNGLSGPIPPELGDLSRLSELSLGENNLSGEIAPELGDLGNLEELILDSNGLSGPIPPELGTLANLRRLDLSDNVLSGPIPPELGDLSRLSELNLYDNGLSGPIPPELGDLAGLRELNLRNNDLSGPIPPEFGGLATLAELELAHNAGLSGALPTSLTGLARLDVLQTGGTDLCAPRDPVFLTWLGSIRERWVGSCAEAMAYLTQAVQSREHAVPLVAGEKALLRVFVTAMRETTERTPPVRARFYLNGAEWHVVDMPAGSTRIPVEVDEGDLSKSVNAEIPGRIVRPGLEVAIEIDPDRTLDPDLGLPERIPATGRMAVDVREMPVLDLTVIPFHTVNASAVLEAADWMATDPDGNEPLAPTRNLLPVGNIVVKTHEPVVLTGISIHTGVSEVEAIRVIEGGNGHYMGLFAGDTIPNSRAILGGRSSIVSWFAHVGFGAGTFSTIAHELGHNISLLHAPCGGAQGPDPSFPHPHGMIGGWGYDLQTGRLVIPDTPDLMTYCGPPDGISGYHFTKALRYRLGDEGAAATLSAVPARSLLLWGGKDAGGNPFLNPAFVVDAPPALPESGGDYTLSGRDARGRKLFSVSFAMPAVADGDGSSSFAFVLPVRPGWADTLAAVILSGPDDSVTLDEGTNRPMAILRDAGSGQVRGFLRDPPLAGTQVAVDAVGRAVGQGTEVLFSRGIPPADAWRR